MVKDFKLPKFLCLNLSDQWVLLESYPIDPTPNYKYCFGPGAQVGLIYVS